MTPQFFIKAYDQKKKKPSFKIHHMQSNFSKVKHLLISQVAIPSRCPLCFSDSQNGSFCKACQHDMLNAMLYYPNRCRHCLLPHPALSICPDCEHQKFLFRHLHALFDYQAPLDQLVLQFKNTAQISLAKAFAKLMVLRLNQLNTLPLPDQVIIPIPSKPSSLKKRHFNPANEYAKQLARQLKLKFDPHLLYTNDVDIQQKSLQRLERRLNVANLFYCLRPANYSSVILVDDIMTTGATLNAAIRALKAAGVKTIDVYVIARATYLMN